MKIFICASFSNKVLPDGSVEPKYRSQIENILKVLEQKGHKVYCALREDNWHLNDLSPTQAFVSDVKAVENCDLALALIRNNPISAGIEFELGVAHTLNKRILILSQDDDMPISYINKGLLEEDKVESYSYRTLDDVPGILKKHVD